MQLPISAVLAYAVTLVTAVGAALVHPWFDDAAHRSEQQFVKAVSELSEVAMSAVSWPSHDLDEAGATR
jgi:hypothetical protein